MSDLTKESVPLQNEAVLFTELDGAMVLMDMDSGQYYDYDEVGGEIWKLIDGTRNVSQICGKLRENFEIDAETCQSDTVDFLKELHRLKLVSIS